MSGGYLADACALIVFRSSPDSRQIMPRAAPLIERSRIRVSAITVWEITRKAALGKLPSVWGGFPSLGYLLRDQGYLMQPLGWEDTELANALPPHHNDPMDRMLIATALRHDFAVLTDDAVFAEYGVTTIW